MDADVKTAKPARISHSPLPYQRLMDARKNVGDVNPDDNTAPRRRQMFGAPRYGKETVESVKRTDRTDVARRYY